MQDIKQGDQHHLGAPALGGERRIDEGEDDRADDREQHPHRGSQRVVRKIGRIERYRRDVECRQRKRSLFAAIDDQHHGADHEDQRHRVPDVGPQRLPQSRRQDFLKRHTLELAVQTAGEDRDRSAVGVMGRISNELIIGRDGEVLGDLIGVVSLKDLLRAIVDLAIADQKAGGGVMLVESAFTMLPALVWVLLRVLRESEARQRLVDAGVAPSAAARAARYGRA